MLVVYLSKSTDKINGILWNYFFEIKHNFFVGDLSKRVCDELWDNLILKAYDSVEVCMLFNYSVESGFTYYKTKGFESYQLYGNEIVIMRFVGIGMQKLSFIWE